MINMFKRVKTYVLNEYNILSLTNLFAFLPLLSLLRKEKFIDRFTLVY